MSNIEKVTSQLPAEMASMFAEDSAENLANITDAFFKLSIQGSRFKVEGKTIGMEGVRFSGIIMRELPFNYYYSTPFNPAKPSPPDCWSMGGLRPDVSVEDKQAETCVSCEKNRFGSAVDQAGAPAKGKACANTRRLVLRIPNVDLPVVFSLPPTSVKPFNQYLKLLSSSQIPVFGVMTTFTFDSDVQYPKPLMEFERVLTSEEYKEIREVRTSDVVENTLKAYSSVDDVAVDEVPF